VSEVEVDVSEMEVRGVCVVGEVAWGMEVVKGERGGEGGGEGEGVAAVKSTKKMEKDQGHGRGRG